MSEHAAGDEAATKPELELDSIHGQYLIAARLHNNIGVVLHNQNRLVEASHHYQESLELRTHILVDEEDLHCNSRSMCGYVHSLERRWVEEVAKNKTADDYSSVCYPSELPIGMHFFQRPQMIDEDIFRSGRDSNPNDASVHESCVKRIVESGQDGSAFTLFNLAVVKYQIDSSDGGEVAAPLHDLVVDQAYKSKSTGKAAATLRTMSAWSLNNMGIIHFKNDRYREAMEMFLAALQRRQFCEDMHDDTEDYARLLLNLSWAYLRMGKVDQAVQSCQRLEAAAAGAASKSSWRADGHVTIIAMGMLRAQIHRERGELARAKELYRNLHRQALPQLTSDEQRTAAAADLFHSLGVVLVAQGDRVDAGRYLLDALRLRRTVHGDMSRPVADTLSVIGRLLHDQEDYEDAIRIYDKVLDILQNQTTLPSKVHDARIMDTLYNLGMAHYLNGNLEEALSLHVQVHDTARTCLPANHPLFLRLLKAIYLMYRELGNDDDAMAILDKMFLECRNSDELRWVASVVDQGSVLRPGNKFKGGAAAPAA